MNGSEAGGTTAGIPTGNTYDKYGSGNPIARLLTSRFLGELGELLVATHPDSLLDVGCGEGILTSGWAAQLPRARVVGLDLEDPKLKAHWSGHTHPNLEFRTGDAGSLPFADGEFDLVTGIEVLEHVQDPAAAMAEMTRVARRFVLVSVPREPIWRVLNVMRGAYVSDLGNTPGHVNHWSAAAFMSFASRYGSVDSIRLPLPWTIALVRVPTASPSGAAVDR